MTDARRRPLRLLSSGICLGVLLLSSGNALATHDTDPKTRGIVVSTDLAINGRHLREAMALGQIALERLQGPGAVEELATTHKTLDLMYRTVRLALSGLRERRSMLERNQKMLTFDDPILDYEIQRTEKAWNTIRWPVDRYFDSLPTDVYIERSIREVQATIALLRPVVALLP